MLKTILEIAKLKPIHIYVDKLKKQLCLDII